MIGIYDSGSGGLHALCAIRKRCPNADILYRGDLAHAPYGTKTREQLLPILRENLSLFRALGCHHILLACMTASSLLPLLSYEDGRGVYPITDAVGMSALALTKNKRVGIVSTSRTMKEGRLKDCLSAHGVSVSESEADILVALAERGQTSPSDTEVRAIVQASVETHLRAGVDTLVLGCTHFPYFEEAFRYAMGEGVSLISSAQAGALSFLKQIPKDVLKGQGHIHFI